MSDLFSLTGAPRAQAELPPVQQASRKGVDPEDIFIDPEQAFLVYATLLGDAEATAAAIGCRPMVIARLADSEKWDERLAPILKKKRSQKPGDVERAINRAINFVSAHRFRMFLERVARQMFSWNEQELHDFLVRPMPAKKDDEPRLSFSARSLADMASAMEKCHAMTYQALSDTATDRKTRQETHDDGELSAAAIHAQIVKAMNEAGQPQTAAGQLAAAQMGLAQVQAGHAVVVSVGAEHKL